MKLKSPDSLDSLGLRTCYGHDLPLMFDWLQRQGLTDTAGVFDGSADDFLPGAQALGDSLAIAQATSRSAAIPRTKDELKNLKEKFQKIQLGINEEALWGVVQNPASSVRTLAWNKLPAEAMAFYRPFHFPPFAQWGIYLLIGPLLHYHYGLVSANPTLKVFSQETLMHLILFEIFNHEFFHHLVESTATTLELIFASQGTPQPVYLRHRRQQARNEFKHPHAPLEEALANAYAYNALGFISRIKAGCKTASIKAYQHAIVNHWSSEPDGYRHAGFYKGGEYVDGGTFLLAQLLNKPEIAHEVPIGVVAKHVMPNGFTALFSKPEIPTWLVGNPAELERFHALVPAPNEAYTQLFWPYNTEKLDAYIAEKQADEKARKAALKAQGAGKR